MPLDTAPYRHHFDGYDLSQRQKDEMIQSVHFFLSSLMDVELGTDATQISLGIDRSGATLGRASAVDSLHTIASTFNDAARESAAGKTTP